MKQGTETVVDAVRAFTAVRKGGGSPDAVPRAEDTFKHLTRPLEKRIYPSVRFVPEAAKELVKLLSDASELKLFPKPLPAKLSCRLTEQWRKDVFGKTIVRCAGADGLMYEHRSGDGWYATGRI